MHGKVNEGVGVGRQRHSQARIGWAEWNDYPTKSLLRATASWKKVGKRGGKKGRPNPELLLPRRRIEKVRAKTMLPCLKHEAAR